MPPSETRVSVPAKLILIGEHAVVYGHPALVAAVEPRLHVRVRRGRPGVRLDLPDLRIDRRLDWSEIGDATERARERWTAFRADPTPAAYDGLRGSDPAAVVVAALGEAAAVAPPDSSEGLDLRVRSGIPAGAGFGSSAATAVGVVAAYLRHRLRPWDRDEIAALALQVERFQHGTPSGVDHATVLHGGIVHAVRRDDALEIRPFSLRSHLAERLAVFDTGTPLDPTGAVVAAVRERRAQAPGRIGVTMARMERLTEDLERLLAAERDDPQAVNALLVEAERCLEHLGVVPDAVRAVVERVERQGGAAKISGAGALRGDAAGCLLVHHPQPGAIESWKFLHAFRRVPLRIGAEGLREERP